MRARMLRPCVDSSVISSLAAAALKLVWFTCSGTSEVKLRSNQGEIFVVEREVACRSVTIKNTVEDTDHETPVPLPIDSMIIAKVLPSRCVCPPTSNFTRAD